MSQEAAFESFSVNLVEAITQALESMGLPVNVDSVLDKAHHIDSFVFDYLNVLAQQHNRKDYQQRDFDIGTDNRLVDHKTLALWYYCKEEKILDQTGSRLFSILQYDPNYRAVLISSLAPTLQKLFGENHANK